MAVEVCIIYDLKNNYIFRPFSLTIFRLINEKLSKQLHSVCVGCTQWGGKRWSGYEVSYFPTVYNPHDPSVAAYQVFHLST